MSLAAIRTLKGSGGGAKEPEGLIHRYSAEESVITFSSGSSIDTVSDLAGSVGMVNSTTVRPTLSSIDAHGKKQISPTTQWNSSTGSGLSQSSATIDLNTHKELTVFVTVWTRRDNLDEPIVAIHRNGAYDSRSCFSLSRVGDQFRVFLGRGGTADTGANIRREQVTNTVYLAPQLLVVRCSVSALSMRIDGVPQSLTLESGTMPQANWLADLGNNSCILRLGTYWTNLNSVANHSQSNIGEFRIYDRVLSDSEVEYVENEISGDVLTPSFASATGADPSVVGSVGFWYDLSDGSTVTLSGSNITNVTDKSGNGRNLTKVGTGNIVYGATTQNGLDLAQSVDGPRLQYNHGTTTLSYPQMSIFYLMRPTALGTNFGRIFGLFNPDGFAADSDPKSVYFAASNPGRIIGVEGGGASSTTGFSVYARTDKWMLLGLKYDTSGAVAQTRINDLTRAGAVTSTTGTYRSIQVMGNSSNSANCDHVCAEVIGFAKYTTAAEDAIVMKYLADKWNVDIGRSK
jgi:hypothetical protein